MTPMLRKRLKMMMRMRRMLLVMMMLLVMVRIVRKVRKSRRRKCSFSKTWRASFGRSHKFKRKPS